MTMNTRPSKRPPEISLYSETTLPTEWGDFRVRVYRTADQEEHLAIYRGDLKGKEGVLTRVHSACFTAEVLGSLKCDCKSQLEYAFSMIESVGHGLIIYLFQEGRGIGLGNKIKAYALQNERGLDTVDANTHLGFEEDGREYDIAVCILDDLEVTAVQLMTNNPLKVKALDQAGVSVLARIPIEIGRNGVNASYLDTKQRRMGHLFSDETAEPLKAPKPLSSLDNNAQPTNNNSSSSHKETM
jgi:GTP cyclohydrolase II